MSLRENVLLAFNSLLINKLRASLTMLGIIIGVAAVVTLLAAGRGVESFVISEFESLGNNLLFVFPGRLEPGQGPRRAGGSGLTYDDAVALADSFLTPDVVAVTPSLDRLAPVTYSGRETRTTISGTTPNFIQVRNFRPVAGRFINDQDISSSARVAVVGQTVYETLFADGGLPIGQTIKINNINFKIIGLMEEKGGSGFNDQDNLILIPLTTAQRRLFLTRRADGKFTVDLIYAQAISEERQEAAIGQIQEVLRQTHGIEFRNEDDFTVLSQNELVSTFSQITSVMTAFLGAIAGISLLVGGIGIMNIMLVSVRERTREIGLRKAVGAKRNDILRQFLTEAVLLAVVGGLIGLAIGMVGAGFIGSLSDSLQPIVSLDSVLLSVGFSAAVGLFFGSYPASRAARLDPIDALRYE
jgi:putative ABC transport system permease protein